MTFATGQCRSHVAMRHKLVQSFVHAHTVTESLRYTAELCAITIDRAPQSCVCGNSTQ
jgi:hypothetical protein